MAYAGTNQTFISSLGKAQEGVSGAQQCLAQDISSTRKPLVSWDNFQKLNGVWGAFNDLQNARTLYERMNKIKYVSRGTIGGMGAFGKNTALQILDNGPFLNKVGVAMAALDTDLGKYVIEGAPEALEAFKQIANSSSEDWGQLLQDFKAGWEELQNNPEMRADLWSELNLIDGEIMEGPRLIVKSLVQGVINVLNPF